MKINLPEHSRLMSLRAKLGRLGLAMPRAWLFHKESNRKNKLADSLQCPVCKSMALKLENSHVACTEFGKHYEVVAGVPRMSVES